MDATTLLPFSAGEGYLLSLERETQSLLDLVNKPKPKRSTNTQRSLSQSADLSNSAYKPKTGRGGRSRRGLSSRGDGSAAGTGGMDKTLDLFNFKSSGGANKVTLEVLDVDLPDGTPRQKLTKKQLAMMEESELQMEDQRRVRTAELKFRTQDFKAERSRILSKTDIFVPGPGVTMDDIVVEKTRLVNMENSARLILQARESEFNTQLGALQQHKAASQVQSTFRGFLGRRKVQLIRRLRELSESESDWIEVRDKSSGDVWFYNKMSGVSQWERPEDLEHRLTAKSNVHRLPHLGGAGRAVKARSSTAKSFRDLAPLETGVGGLSAVKFAADNVANNLQREADEARALEDSAAKEVEGLLGLQYMMPEESLLAPDGTFKRPQLRETIKDALLETKFDSVAALLADINDAGPSPYIGPRATSVPSMRRRDPSRKPFIAVLGSGKKSRQGEARLAVERATTSQSTRDLTMREVDHAGFGSADDGFSQSTMCFGCWSAGNKKTCAMHSDGPKKKSETMLLCRNWELAVLRRRYRSEEIQELFLQRAASLKYDVKRKKFLTVIEQRHPVYRMLNALVAQCNRRSMLWTKVVHWSGSLVELLHSGHITTPKAIALGELMRARRNEENFRVVRLYKRRIYSLLPVPPITGYSWAERIGEERILVKRLDPATASEVDIIQIGPYPVPVKLYQPREYPLSLPRTIPMPQAVPLAAPKPEPLRNVYLPTSNSAAWLEIACKAVSIDCIAFACSQIQAITPLAGNEEMRRIKEPPVRTVRFATLGRKPRPGMLDVGGLPAELLVSQLVVTFVPPQYGSLIVMDKTTIGPAHGPEISITFASLALDPIAQVYVTRHLDHILNFRKSPTITISTEVGIDEKFFYGLNRPEQTGEMESKGFRTTELATAFPVPKKTHPQSFTPALEIASLNDPRANHAVTTKVDGLYPFCEPSTRDNSTLDFYHLLLEGKSSASRPQVFTAISVQEAGQFLVDMRTDLPLGHLLVSIYRSWAFTQREIYEEFKSDDGVPYWYHRRTGQTFWERPLYEEEKGSPLSGATKVDEQHKEEPSVGHAAQEGGVRRADQGEFRKQILTKHESVEDATKRRKSAAASIASRKAAGLVPPLAVALIESSVAMDAVKIDSNPEVTTKAASVESSIVTIGSSCEAVDAQIPSSVALERRQQSSPPSDTAATSKETDNALMMDTLTRSIDQLMSMHMFDKASPQDMVKLGLGMGLAILNQTTATTLSPPAAKATIAKERPALFFPSLAEGAVPPAVAHDEKYPIGAPKAQTKLSLNPMLKHEEEEATLQAKAKALTSLDRARELVVLNAAEESVKRTSAMLPVNADEAVKAKVPVLVYPELSTTIEGGAPSEYLMHAVAGVGESFTIGDETAMFVKDSAVELRKTTLPFPQGFYEAIVAKHVAKQATSYLPQVPNLPQTHIVGRVKPRSAARDWLVLNFDPWSAGKAPLNTIFIANLATQKGKLFKGGEEELEQELEIIRSEVTRDAFINLEDREGIANARAVTSRANVLAADFKKLCSLARHGKFEEVENLMDQSDWEVPINYVDDQGRTLLHIVAQNGNKRLVKLCLRRGISINAQTLTGQSALHYAFGFGFAALGEYMISKGADDSIRNSAGLTCYEGLESKHVNFL